MSVPKYIMRFAENTVHFLGYWLTPQLFLSWFSRQGLNSIQSGTNKSWRQNLRETLLNALHILGFRCSSQHAPSDPPVWVDSPHRSAFCQISSSAALSTQVHCYGLSCQSLWMLSFVFSMLLLCRPLFQPPLPALETSRAKPVISFTSFTSYFSWVTVLCGQMSSILKLLLFHVDLGLTSTGE